MGAYDFGGGGGPATFLTENDADALSRLYELGWPITAETLQQLNEMLDQLYKSIVKRKAEITALAAIPIPTASIVSVVVNISNAELAAMATTPKVILAAPGAGITAVPLYAMVVSLATVAYTNGPLFKWRYTGLSGNTVFGVDKTPRLDLLTPQFMQFLPQEGQFSGTAISNKGVEVSFSTALTGAGNATSQVLLVYTLFTQSLN